jgi:hypothetical protein
MGGLPHFPYGFLRMWRFVRPALVTFSGFSASQPERQKALHQPGLSYYHHTQPPRPPPTHRQTDSHSHAPQSTYDIDNLIRHQPILPVYITISCCTGPSLASPFSTHCHSPTPPLLNPPRNGLQKCPPPPRTSSPGQTCPRCPTTPPREAPTLTCSGASTLNRA